MDSGLDFGKQSLTCNAEIVFADLAMTCRNTILSAFALAMSQGFAQAQDPVRTKVVDVEVYDYTYDHAERLVSVSVTRNGREPTTIVRNIYDEFGRLQRQMLGDVAAVDYEYNVRGWITSVGSDNFSQTISYEPCYNGDISAMEWTAKDVPESLAKVTQTYRYGYDDLDRLQYADYSSVLTTDVVLTMQNGRDYSCRYAYNFNGNVTSLHRKGVSDAVTADGKTYWTFGDIDNLSFTYDGNQLKKVVDQADDLTYAGAMDFKDGADKSTEYTYDANGNTTSDKNRKIHSITYNVLNLPSKVTFNDGHIIQYTYDADGCKLKAEYLLSGIHFLDWDVKKVSPAALGEVIERPSLIVKPVTQATVQYCANHVYRNGTLERVDNGYGYWADSTYHYNITDYQGNIRAVLAADGTLEEVNNYYPYGALMAAGGVQPHKYGGKELERENGLDWYDSRARWYDSLIGRTPTLDPKADHYTSLSPYLWCAGNPMKYQDPTGEKLHFHGHNQSIAIDDLERKTSLRLCRIKDGVIVYNGYPQNDIDRKLAEIINNETIDVHIIITDDKSIIGGSFDGSNVVNGIVHTQQRINTDNLHQIDVWYNMPEGTSLFHEIVESYYGGLDSPNSQPTTGFINKDGDYESNSDGYRKAHKKAADFDAQFVTPIIEFDTSTNSFKLVKEVQLKDRIVLLRKELK